MASRLLIKGVNNPEKLIIYRTAGPKNKAGGKFLLNLFYACWKTVMNSMKKLLILMSVGFLAGCAVNPPPLSVEELREEFRSGGLTGIQVEEYEVERPFIPAFHAIQTNAKRCFEVTVTKLSENDPNARAESIRYRSDSLMNSETEGETILQLDRKDNNKMPDGGYYVLLADIEALSSNKTRVTIYRALSGYENVNESIVSWAQGKSDECPRFPQEAKDWRFTYHTP